MEKLEMYNLANAAHWMDQRDGYPYIESLCNQRDSVRNRPSVLQPIDRPLWVYVLFYCARYYYTSQREFVLKGLLNRR